MTPRRIAVVLKGYPRLSETFIAQELLGLQQRGLNFTIYSLRQPHDDQAHPAHNCISAPVFYLPEYLHDAPLRVLRGFLNCRKYPGLIRALSVWWQDLKRDVTRNRLRRFGQALVLASELDQSTDWIYAHFMHTPASVARYAAIIRGLPWSCSAHAKDIYTTPLWEKKEKLADMEWLVTCTRANVEHLKALDNGHGNKIDLVYHGLDLARFAPPNDARRSDPVDNPVRLLSVGRAVEKKGYDDVLKALALLPDDLDWRFVHVGGGQLLKDLGKLARDLGIADRIEWYGPMAQDSVMAAYRNADIFVLASRIAEDGDRDGLPNVLMEAQSQGLATVSTSVSAIPELVIDEETGILVEPSRPNKLASAIERLIRDAPLREELAAAGARRVRLEFGHEKGIRELAQRFGLTKAGPQNER